MSTFLRNRRPFAKKLMKFLPRIGLLLLALFLLVGNGADNTLAQTAHASTNVAEANPIGHYHPRIEQNADTENSIYIYNPSSEDRPISFSFFNMDGTSQFDETGVVPANSYFIMSDTNIDSFLADGTYTFEVISTDNLSVAVREYNTATKTLSLARGQSLGAVTISDQVYGPFFKTAARNSSIYLQAYPTSDTSITAEAVDGGGNVLQTITKSINAGGGVTISANEFDQLTDFTGLVRVTSNDPVFGLLAPTSKQNQIGLYPPLGASGTAQIVAASAPGANSYIPRAYSSFSQDGIGRETEIFIANKESEEATMTLTAYKADGTVDGQGAYNVQGSGYLHLAPLTAVSSGFAGSMVFSSNRNIVAAELTQSSGGHAMASYGGNTITANATVRQRAITAAPAVPTGSPSSTEDPHAVTMPYISHGADHFSILTLQNKSSTNQVTVNYTFIDQNGERMSDGTIIPPNSPLFVDTRNLSELANGFAGIVKITSNERLSTYVDEYVSTDGPLATPTPAVTDTPMPTATPTPTPTVTPTPSPTQPSQTTTIPPVAELTAIGITTDIDPDTAEVTVTIARSIGSDLTARSVATCVDGSTPDEVEFVMAKPMSTNRYPMTPVIVGLYEATIPQSDVNANAELLVSVTCSGDDVTSSTIGAINIQKQFTKSSKTVRLPIMGR